MRHRRQTVRIFRLSLCLLSDERTDEMRDAAERPRRLLGEGGMSDGGQLQRDTVGQRQLLCTEAAMTQHTRTVIAVGPCSTRRVACQTDGTV